MKKNHFWFLSLVALFIIACANHWTFWLRIAVIANAIVVLIGVATRLYGQFKKDGKKV